MIDTATIGEDTYTSSLPWSRITQALYKPTGEISPEKISILRQKEIERSSNSTLYQNYLHDRNTLDQIRNNKAVSLQERAFKAEIETIKQIEKQWIQEPDGTKDVTKDVLLNEAAGVVSDL